ncbi:GAF domain-containing protein [Virgibacillus halodenitrificans]|uniref:GAF domain-containing protein n=1 Tax=Virgibacillus halodenitrificans TaxID=1482 RepID=A0ABR7VPQ7_VIRHA|nr:GAF domain-containing protein [Virgibacillus halodenitrificans]MBD1223902.1 GAF domain-containing protein [Virgibacillus halodenitrificans]MCJ0931775.1 GAF domain-containing protein [Virgibacillus halodenitrificans]MEC2159826.1 GAF domain-containing protein [Virgibacillus halodenitrificans]WHX27771.1 GAF domain-containing protein [Virgibacillus halodenitrificans]CDQ37020.1 Free methionine-R-sulfoxide reductase [Virgibacillus halodenitrificans]
MFQVTNYSGNRAKDYELLNKQLRALSEGETDEIALLSNASALLNQFLSEVNWVGFYLFKKNELVLGPFQGLPACIRIPAGKGVCGTAIEQRATQLVADVTAFPGHIACDSASKSEIVIPIELENSVYGVLDIDSPITNRFDETDQHYLEEFVAILQEYLA